MIIAVSGHSDSTVMEYRGIDLESPKEQLFYYSAPAMDKSVAEYMAIIHAVKYCEKNKIGDISIFTDSYTALLWVKSKKNTATPIDTMGEPKLKRLDESLVSVAVPYLVKIWEPEYGTNPARMEYFNFWNRVYDIRTATNTLAKLENGRMANI